MGLGVSPDEKIFTTTPVVAKIDIVESVEDLKELMKQQKSTLAYAKPQSLYFLKMGEVETVRHLAVLMGRGERTIHPWLSFSKKRRNRAIIIGRKPTWKTEKDFDRRSRSFTKLIRAC